MNNSEAAKALKDILSNMGYVDYAPTFDDLTRLVRALEAGDNLTTSRDVRTPCERAEAGGGIVTYANGSNVEVVRQGTILRGRVTDCTTHTAADWAYRIVCEGGYIYWVSETQVIGEVL